MKMLQHSRFGEPDEVLELLEQDLPPPSPREVRVEAASLHIDDLKNIAGENFSGGKTG